MELNDLGNMTGQTTKFEVVHASTYRKYRLTVAYLRLRLRLAHVPSRYTMASATSGASRPEVPFLLDVHLYGVSLYHSKLM